MEMELMFSVVGMLALLLVILRALLGSPFKQNNKPIGEWIAEVYLIGEYNYRIVVFRRLYLSNKEAVDAAAKYTKKALTKLTKKYGEGFYPNSIKLKDGDHIVLQSVSRVNFKSIHQLTPVNRYKLR